MLRALRPLFGALLAVCFSANALAPGLLHGCESGAAAVATQAVADGGHGAHGTGHAHHGAAPAEQPERPSGDGCDCVGHSCCVAAPALPAPATIPLDLPVLTAVPVVVLEAAPVAVRPDRLLPFAQAPPA